MGIDLTIVPQNFPQLNDHLAYTRLGFMFRDYDYFDELQKISRPLNEVFRWYDDEGLTKRDDDKYGDKLTFIMASDFLKVKKVGKRKLSDWDKAIFAFIKALEPSTKLVLFWH